MKDSSVTSLSVTKPRTPNFGLKKNSVWEHDIFDEYYKEFLYTYH
jgi:hypothetical protein